LDFKTIVPVDLENNSNHAGEERALQDNLNSKPESWRKI